MKAQLTVKRVAMALVGLLFLVSAKQSIASIEPGTTIGVSCDYDSSFTDIAIRISNYNTIASSAGYFCALGLTSFTDVLSNISYVVVVDSGTMDRVADFPVFVANSMVANEWESVLATGSWQGFYSEIGAGGLAGGKSVEIIVRATLPGGYTLSRLDSNLCMVQIGSDYWDDSMSALANSHQYLKGFWDGGCPSPYTGHGAGSTFFSDLDNSVLTAAESDYMSKQNLRIYPVPSAGLLNFEVGEGEKIEEIQIADVNGKIEKRVSGEGLRKFVLEVDLPDGMYFAHVRTSKGLIYEEA